jgi:hypothetical protein
MMVMQLSATPNRSRHRVPPAISLLLGLGFAAAGLFLAGGCADSTSPESGPATIVFVPDVDSVSLDLMAELPLSVRLTNVASAQVRFIHQGSEQQTSTYLYRAEHLGVDSVQAQVVLPDTTLRKDWRIRVDIGDADRTPAVRQLSAENSSRPSAIDVSWLRPALLITPRPLQCYQVGISDVPVVDAAGWDAEVEVLEEVVAAGSQEMYHRTYSSDSYAAVWPGRECVLVVRGLDVAGVYSLPSSSAPLRISAPYWLEGRVTDEAGRALAGVLVSYGCDTCKTITRSDGLFRFGPLRDIDRFVLRATDDGLDSPGIGDYFDVYSDTLDVDSPQPVQLSLIRAWPLASDCTRANYGQSFLTFLRKMTLTDSPDPGGDYPLLKWEQYPIPICIYPPVIGSGGFDLAERTRVAVAMWNERLGEDYLTIVDTPEEARCDVYFVTNISSGVHGLVDVLEPVGGNLNQVIPQRLRMRIDSDVPDEVYALEVILHELGHVLHLRHVLGCSYLMGINPGGILDAHPPPDSPISDDEARAVTAIRYLPQRQQMDHYLVD